MTFTDLRRLAMRRWYLLVGGLVITLIAAVVVVVEVGQRYSMQAVVVLVPPAQTENGYRNPFFDLSGLRAASDVVANALGDPSTVSKVSGASSTATYTAISDPNSPAPLINLAVEDSSLPKVKGALDTLLGAVPETVSRLQADIKVPDSSRITTSILSRSDSASSANKSLVRLLVVIVAAGLAVTLLGVAAADALILRRRPRHRHGGPDKAQGGPDRATSAQPVAP